MIPRPIGAGRAFAAAGVRQLGSAVSVELLECVDAVEDPETTHLLRARRDEIGRVLGCQSSGSSASEALARLQNIACESVKHLLIRYRLDLFNNKLQSDPEEAPALYQADRGTLLFVRRALMPWSAIARELAIALLPEEDPGRYAAGLKEVLAARTIAEAAATLDELGFARLDTAVHEPPKTREAADTLGTDLPPGRDAAEQPLDRGVSAPTPPRPDPGSELGGVGPPSGAVKTPGAAKRNSRDVLRSYLSPDLADSRRRDADGPSHSAVGEAGVRLVLEYEKANGRVPNEMSHGNPGYDIESRDATGQLLRIIEVKSFSGSWRNTFAELSRRQFEKANESGAAFWLYVVERSESDDFEIVRIQNPALRANRFMFDDGWRATAELALSSQEEE